MQSNVVTKLYQKSSKNKDQERELFNFLLGRLPKQSLYAFRKEEFKFKKTTNTREALAKSKFIHYNQNLVTELIFDIDYISHLSIYDLEWIFKTFLDKTGIIPSWVCYTDHGIQFCISLNTFYKLSKKQIQVLREFKKYMIENWPLLDSNGSTRLKGWWRNPLTQKDFIFTGWVTTFEEILDFLYKNKLSIKKQFKANVRKEQIKQAKANTTDKIRFTIGEPVIGNRNNFIWYNLMLASNSKDFNTLLQLAQKLNEKTEKKLDEKELEKIAKSVLKYNIQGKNFIYANSKKANWNIGAMGFEKIAYLSYEKYKKEVKRRQKMAGKRTGNTIGKEVLIKANQKKAEITKEKVYKAIKELKEKGEKVTIMKVKELAQVSYATTQKYVKKAKEEGIIG